MTVQREKTLLKKREKLMSLIYSMTAFARKQLQTEWGTFICEIRSINHRYLDLKINVPDHLQTLEMSIRETLGDHLKRGKLDYSLQYTPNPETSSASHQINKEWAHTLCRMSEEIASFLQKPAAIQPEAILRFPDVLKTQEMDTAALTSEVLELTQTTIHELSEIRLREGNALKAFMEQRIEQIKQALQTISQHLPAIILAQRERLINRLKELQLEADPQRLEQEMVIWAHKSDVSEELDRLNVHLTEMERILAAGGAVGRRLDFLLQELNREANTLGSKASNTAVAHAVVDVKVLLEQIREQVQNLE